MLKRRNKFLTSLLILGFGLTFSIGQVVPANASKWKLSDDKVDLGLSGVSPHVIKTSTGDLLFRSDQLPTGTGASLCDDSGNCVEETFSSSVPVSDYTVAKAKSGWRAYFKKIDGSNQGVYSAPCTTSDCLSYGSATLTSSEMVVPKETKAWGVPDAVTLPNGKVRIYIVESPNLGLSCPEKVASYISDDGISFTKEKGWRLQGGYVDTEVLRVKNKDWVMIVADGPGCGGTKGSQKPQQLYVTTSKDGLKWAKPKVLTGTDTGRLDPTGYETKKNTFRIYYASGSITTNNYEIKRATLSLKK